MDFHSPSPSSVQLNISPQSPFDSFEFNHLQSPPFPHTPSYNGSYQNSPYSGHSELSFGGEGDSFGLFDEEPAGITIQDYDPAEYDAPNSSSLLMFNDGDYMNNFNQVSVSVTPAIDHMQSHSFDHSSPSSGGGDSGPEGERSRASSISSNHNNGPSSSSRLDVAQTFENMRFESPNWGNTQLPMDRSMSPPHKPQSPPQLMIPDSSSPSTSSFPQPPPIINAPAGDGGLMSTGPQLHIVPATPVSGGGAASQSVPFQTSLETLHQGELACPPSRQFRQLI